MKKVVLGMIILVMISAFIVPAAVFAQGAREAVGERHAFVFKNTGNPYTPTVKNRWRGVGLVLRSRDIRLSCALRTSLLLRPRFRLLSN